MDINTMPAGPEMDALVAEKVMGWKYAPHRIINGNDHGPGLWSPDYGDPKDPAPGACALGAPLYSKSISAAWEVVERMKSRWGEFRLKFGPYLVRDGKLTNGWELEPAWGSPIFGYGETAPLAICRAAIKACIPSGE